MIMSNKKGIQFHIYFSLNRIPFLFVIYKYKDFIAIFNQYFF